MNLQSQKKYDILVKVSLYSKKRGKNFLKRQLKRSFVMKLINYVNTKHGTASLPRFSNGNTLPLVQRPFGFASFAPWTDSTRGNWYYHPGDRSLEGIRLTRQPSPWIGEQGSICIMPKYQIAATERPDGRWSGIRPEDAVLMPHYMKYDVLRARATIELTPTNSGACIRVRFRENTRPCFISVTPGKLACSYEVRENMIVGYTNCMSLQKERKNAKLYFAFKFAPGDIEKVIDETNTERAIGDTWEGANAQAHVKTVNKCIEFKLSSSLISVEQALLNMEREHTYSDFDSLMSKNEDIWEEYLSRIKIKTDDEDMMRTFYSCLYRAYLYPHKAYELDENDKPIHYSPGKDCVCDGYRYTDNGFWDTYRTVYSMLPLLDFEEYERMINSYVAESLEDDGWLPRWTATEPKACMPSTAIDMVLLDAAKRGALKGEMLELALKGMMKHANEKSEYSQFGRSGCEEYVKLGYVPNSYHESVNLTLDAAYGDWCIAQIAKMLGKNDIYDEYMVRSKNYKNVFDKETGFMRSRDAEGNFREGFAPESWGLDYTEASAWQTSFAVQHDLEGLAELHGGKEALLKKLDEFFAEPPVYLIGGYGREIHEMTEFAAADWGQCAISNQPSFHIPFIYAYFGQKDKTEMWLKKICSEGFSYKDDGYPGDEDNGTTACWFMFAAMGFYPMTPGNAKYLRFKGLVDDVTIKGKKIDELIEIEETK